MEKLHRVCVFHPESKWNLYCGNNGISFINIRAFEFFPSFNLWWVLISFIFFFFLRVHLYSIDISTRVVVRFILAQDLIEDTLSSSILSFRFRQNFHRDLYFLEITFFLYFNNNNTCNVFLRYRICLHIIFRKPGSQEFYNLDRYFLSTIHLDPFPVSLRRQEDTKQNFSFNKISVKDSLSPLYNY